jgi:penicillin amidase
VDVLFTEGGIPHVYAKSEEDLFFAQGYLTAAERLFQMDFTRRAASGRLCEILGSQPLPWRDLTVHLKNKTTIDLDHLVRVLCLGRSARESAAAAGPRARRALERYAQGVNARISEGSLPLEFGLLSYSPEAWAPMDSCLVEKAMALEMNVSWRTILGYAAVQRELKDPRQAASLLPAYPPDAETIVGADPALSALSVMTSGAIGLGGPHAGSNNWVLSGTRTESGAPYLCNDPHVQLTAPAAFYVAHLSGGDFDVAGATLPGVPGVILGHNRHLAWGATLAFAHDTDLFVEEVTDDRYRIEDRLEPLRVRTEEIQVKGEPPSMRKVRETRHGPLLSDVVPGADGRSLAFSWTGSAATREVDAVLGMNLARDPEELGRALSLHSAPALNIVYADRRGSIGYLLAGAFPTRRGKARYLPQPGADGSCDWTGTVPRDALPRVENPLEGFVVTANHRIAPEGFPHYLSDLYEPPYRARRIAELLREKPRHSLSDMERIQNDVRSLWAQRIIRDFLFPLAQTELPTTERAREALVRMVAWDGAATKDSREALVFYAFYQSLIRRVFAEQLGDDAFFAYFEVLNGTVVPVENLLLSAESPFLSQGAREDLALRALEDALFDLRRRLGADESTWRYGRVHRLHLRHRLHGARALRPLLSPGPFETSGDGMTVNNGHFSLANPTEHRVGAGYRQIFDLADWDLGRVVVAGGQSGDPLSPGYRDHIVPWLSGRYFPLPFSREAVERGARPGRGRLLPLL